MSTTIAAYVIYASFVYVPICFYHFVTGVWFFLLPIRIAIKTLTSIPSIFDGTSELFQMVCELPGFIVDVLKATYIIGKYMSGH